MHMFDPPADGWTPERKARFLTLLAESGNVRRSAGRCGLSAQSVYKLRRRDAVFARGWGGALLLARDHSEQVLADRALEGVEEAVFYRGEQVGTRRKYDTRLLLAHMARLDRQAELAERAGAAVDAERFDELVALIAGEDVPETLDVEADGLPMPRGAYLAALAQELQNEMIKEVPAPIDEDEEAEHIDRINAAVEEAWHETAQRWDGWFESACARVDGLDTVKPPLHLLPEGCTVLARPSLKAWTLSTVSTDALVAGAQILPAAKRRGGGPPAQRMAEGSVPKVKTAPPLPSAAAALPILPRRKGRIG